MEAGAREYDTPSSEGGKRSAVGALNFSYCGKMIDDTIFREHAHSTDVLTCFIHLTPPVQQRKEAHQLRCDRFQEGRGKGSGMRTTRA